MSYRIETDDCRLFKRQKIVSEETDLHPVFYPAEIMLKIFSSLKSSDLKSCCLVSKQWHHIAIDETLWKNIIYREIAFGKEKWAQHFGDVGEEPPLPLNILEILKAPCPYFPQQTVAKTHLLVLIPKKVDDKFLTPNSLTKFKHGPKYALVYAAAMKEYGNTPVRKSFWALMTWDIIPESTNIIYAEQKALVEKVVHYRVPKLLEALISVATESSAGRKLFVNSFTSCQEEVRNPFTGIIHQLLVGFCHSSSLTVYTKLITHPIEGVAALREL